MSKPDKPSNGSSDRALIQFVVEEVRFLRDQSDRRFAFLVLLIVASIVRPFIERAL